MSSQSASLILIHSLYRNRPSETDFSGDNLTIDADEFSLNTSPNFISTDPTQAGYLQLVAGSPAINAGDNQLYTDAGGDLANDVDLAGNPRVYQQVDGGIIDMRSEEQTS